MSATNYVGKAFEHALQPLKGYMEDSFMNVDIHGDLSSNVNIGSTNNPVYSGMVVHVQSITMATVAQAGGQNPTPNFEMGAAILDMPIYLWPNQYEYSVTSRGVPAGVSAGGDSSNIPTHHSGLPYGDRFRLFGLVANDGLELASTEFDTAQTYTPNQLLRAVTDNTDDDAGKLTNQVNTGAGAPGFTSGGALTTYTDTAVGQVSRGVYTNSYGKSVLAFWSKHVIGTR